MIEGYYISIDNDLLAEKAVFPVVGTDRVTPRPEYTSTYDPDIPCKLVNCMFTGVDPLYGHGGLGVGATNDYFEFYLKRTTGDFSTIFMTKVSDTPQTIFCPLNIMLERGDVLYTAHYRRMIGRFVFTIDTRPLEIPAPEPLAPPFKAAECDPFFRGIHSVPNYV